MQQLRQVCGGIGDLPNASIAMTALEAVLKHLLLLHCSTFSYSTRGAVLLMSKPGDDKPGDATPDLASAFSSQ